MIRIFLRLKYNISIILFKLNWRKANKHNFTNAQNIFPIERVSVGSKTYGPLHAKTFGGEQERLIIGSYCSIAEEVKFLLGGEHNYKSLSTFPFKVKILREKIESVSKGPIIIKDDVWIGERCLILSGVTIGQGAIIAAGSVVAKDIPPYAIYGSGKIIKYRFPQDIVERLLEFDFSRLEESEIKYFIDYLYSDVSHELLEVDFLKRCMKK